MRCHVNHDLLKEYASGDVNFMLELLSIYKNETPKAMNKLSFIQVNELVGIKNGYTSLNQAFLC